MRDIMKFIDKKTNEILAITFDYDCTWHLIDFVDSEDVIVEWYVLDEAEDIVDILNEQSREIEKLQQKCTIYQYENNKHIERYDMLIEKVQELQQKVNENKTDKEKQLEIELHECEKFRYEVFNALNRHCRE